MKKLINGIIEFRKQSIQAYREKFSNLAYGQSPDTLFVACCDSRVVPNAFASTNPGDLFVLRNIGNLISPVKHSESHDESCAAAIEFAVSELHVKDIIICGHSECAAMQAVIDGRCTVEHPSLQAWLRHAEPAYQRYKNGYRIHDDMAMHNAVSQINVLQQVEHLKTYTCVHDQLSRGALKIHAWWFDLATADVHYFDSKHQHYKIIDDSYVLK